MICPLDVRWTIGFNYFDCLIQHSKLPNLNHLLARLAVFKCAEKCVWSPQLDEILLAVISHLRLYLFYLIELMLAECLGSLFKQSEKAFIVERESNVNYLCHVSLERTIGPECALNRISQSFFKGEELIDSIFLAERSRYLTSDCKLMDICANNLDLLFVDLGTSLNQLDAESEDNDHE